jgi:hypothetical protein
MPTLHITIWPPEVFGAKKSKRMYLFSAVRDGPLPEVLEGNTQGQRSLRAPQGAAALAATESRLSEVLEASEAVEASGHSFRLRLEIRISQFR